MAHYLHASPIKTKTVDALGREHFASYYLKDHTAIIELAEACGLKHLKREEYDILNTNTAGFGVLINHAISQGANNLILCVGGSASVDGGIGALREMGLTIVNNSPNRNYITDIKGINTELLQQKLKKFILQYCVMSISYLWSGGCCRCVCSTKRSIARANYHA